MKSPDLGTISKSAHSSNMAILDASDEIPDDLYRNDYLFVAGVRPQPS